MHYNEFKIVGLDLIRTGLYGEVPHRSWTSCLDDGLLRELGTVTRGGERITRGAIDTVASRIMRPSTRTSGIVHLPNVDEDRCRFILTVETSRMGQTTTHVINGFTDHYGVNDDTGTVDKNMLLYVNSYRCFRNDIDYGTNRTVRRSIGSNQVIRPLEPNSRGRYGRDANYTGTQLLRPSDIVEEIIPKVMAGEHLHNDDDDYDHNQRASRHRREETRRITSGLQRSMSNSNKLIGEAKVSKRDWGNPTDFLFNTLDTVRCSLKSRNDMNEDVDDAFENAYDALADETIATNEVFKAFIQECAFTQSGSISIAELQRVQREFPVHLSRLDRAERATQNALNNGDPLDGSDNSAIAGTIIMSTLPDILVAQGVTCVNFSASNESVSGKSIVIVEDVRTNVGSITEREIARIAPILEREILQQIVNPITYNDNLRIDMSVDMDIYNRLIVDIDLGNDGFQRLRWNMWADSSFALVVTNDQRETNLLADDMFAMIQATTEYTDGDSDEINLVL